MSDAIEVKIDSKVVDDAIRRLDKAAAYPRPAYLGIGEKLVLSTKQRFVTGTAPDGSRWEPNSQATYLQQFVDSEGHKLKSLHRKDGKINARGSDKAISKKPLIGKSGALSQQIDYRLDENGLRIGSPMEYASMQQHGGKKSKFPNLWGDIPARQFLGVSSNDEQMIVNSVGEYLTQVVGS
jgi:phage gpG-like protein